MSASLPQNAIKLLLMQPHMTTVVHKLYSVDGAAKLNCVNWYHQGMYAENIDPTLALRIMHAALHIIPCYPQRAIT